MRAAPSMRLGSAIAAGAAMSLQFGAGVARAQPAVKVAPVVNGTALVQTLDCANSEVTVNGSGNRLAFTGMCRGLHVNGDDNRIQIALIAGAPVDVAGHGNRVLYSSDGETGPNLAIDGADNQVTANDEPPAGALVAVVPAPPRQPVLTLPSIGAPAGAIVLSVDGDRETVDCAGRDVLIHGNDGDLRLVGGCRSISVQGQNNNIWAQLQPGARVLIGAPSVTLRYILTAEGPPPVVSATASNTTVTQVQNFDDGRTITLPAGTPVVIAQPR